MMEILLFSLSLSGIGRTEGGSMAQIQSEIQFLGNDNLVYDHLRHQESLAAEHETCLGLPELGARGGGVLLDDDRLVLGAHVAVDLVTHADPELGGVSESQSL